MFCLHTKKGLLHFVTYWHKLYPKPTKYALHRNFRKSFARKSDHVSSIISRVVEDEMFGIENWCWISSRESHILSRKRRSAFGAPRPMEVYSN
ncbi:unnamed protein product [Brassica rapa subsp. narinosa]